MVKIKLPPYLDPTLTAEGVWRYLQKLRDGPWARDVAWAVGMRADSEEFERKLLAFSRYVVRQAKEMNQKGEPRIKKPINFFVKKLYGIPDPKQKKTWNQVPDNQDEDDASIKWKQLKFSTVEVS